MQRLTASQKANTLSRETKEQIRNRIAKGDSISSICRDLKQEYTIVQAFCWREGILPWTGAKRYITGRLNRLAQARRQSDRQQLADEIKEKVDYIYYAAKELTRQKEKAKKSLELSA